MDDLASRVTQDGVTMRLLCDLGREVGPYQYEASALVASQSDEAKICATLPPLMTTLNRLCRAQNGSCRSTGLHAVSSVLLPGSYGIVGHKVSWVLPRKSREPSRVLRQTLSSLPQSLLRDIFGRLSQPRSIVGTHRICHEGTVKSSRAWKPLAQPFSRLLLLRSHQP